MTNSPKEERKSPGEAPRGALGFLVNPGAVDQADLRVDHPNPVHRGLAGPGFHRRLGGGEPVGFSRRNRLRHVGALGGGEQNKGLQRGAVGRRVRQGGPQPVQAVLNGGDAGGIGGEIGRVAGDDKTALAGFGVQMAAQQVVVRADDGLRQGGVVLRNQILALQPDGGGADHQCKQNADQKASEEFLLDGG